MKTLASYVFRHILGIACMLILLISACRKENIIYTTTADVNILGYLDENPEQFSEFRKVLTLTKTAPFLGAYGEYTVFAPTNEAVSRYLQEKGLSAVEQLGEQQLMDMVKYHILQDTIATTAFTDGKLPRLTMYGQYLITGVSAAEGAAKYTVNRTSNIVGANIRTGNGIIHSIDKILEPASKTLAEMVSTDARFSIFSQVLKETGFYDSLNVLPANNTNADSVRRWQTLLVESDQVLAAAGFPTYESLKARLSKTGNPKNPKDSLYLFAAYHILPDAKYLADIVSSTSHSTFAPFEVITTKQQNDQILVNDDTFNGLHEPGIGITRTQSDNSASNGVMHVAGGHFSIKVRSPYGVYFDVTDQPELMSQAAFNGGVINGIVKLAGVRWESGYTINYQGNAGNGHFKGNRFAIPFAGNPSTKRAHWFEFDTPLIVRGRYKVWVSYRTNGRSPLAQVYVDGNPLARILNFAEYGITKVSDSEMEALGFKWHTEQTSSSNYVCRYLGTIDIATTDKHVIRFEGIGTGAGDGNGTWIDMVHFIPADIDQLWPRFHTNGTIIQKPTN